MGRKIPGKKHRGIKDPEKQRAKKWAELKTKVDAPPKDIDEQVIPKSLERVIKLKDALKSGKMAAKKRKKKRTMKGLITLGVQNPQRHPNAKPEKSVPIFNQNPGESNAVFMNRVSRETHLFLNETKFEEKFNVEIKRNPETGNIEGVEKAPKDEIDELMKLKLKHKNIGKKKKKKKNKETGEIEPKLTKVQKRKRKLDLKKEKKMRDKIDDSKGFREKIEFGEVVHAPPNLKLKPIKTGAGTIGERKDLILNSLFTAKDNAKGSKTGKCSMDKTGKRKDLPSAERRLLEKQQSDIIAAYRLLKSRNTNDVK